MNIKFLPLNKWMTFMAWMALIVYLFVSAPPPLEEDAIQGKTLPIAEAFLLVEQINDTVRTVWTREIVAAGKRSGLEFSEDWRQDGEQAGPLPALFLRETARNLEKKPVRLSLYLGSDRPINEANQFLGVQQAYFEKIRTSGRPQFFHDPDTGRYTAMFADIAVAKACIECHNEHPQSPKDDWQLQELMGATTWAYPRDKVTFDELLTMLETLQQACAEAYQRYLKKVSTFDHPPLIGERWPRDGYFLPSREVFMAEIQRRVYPRVLTTLMALAEDPIDASNQRLADLR